MKKIMRCVVLVLTMLVAAPGLIQAVCVSDCPAVLGIHESHCVQLCGPGSLPEYRGCAFQLVGIYRDSTAVPQLVFQRGCTGDGITHCNVECTPIAADSLHPYRRYDPANHRWEWYDSTRCLTVHYHYLHTENTWVINFFSPCGGCFCVTFDNQLAAELIQFEAVPGTRDITLNWTTASESETDRWLVQRGESDSGPFTPVTNLSAAREVTGATYTWVDENVRPGVEYFYRLSEQDIDGNVRPLSNIAHAELISGTGTVPQAYALRQNYPNPFNASTQIVFDMKEPGFVTLAVYNLLGQPVATLVRSEVGAGTHTVNFDAARLPSGLYVYRMETNGFAARNKLLLMK